MHLKEHFAFQPQILLLFTCLPIKFSQLGVSKVEDLKHVLGTAEDVQSTKTQRDDDEPSSSSKKFQAESQFYRDSSTFLKVRRNALVDDIHTIRDAL